VSNRGGASSSNTHLTIALPGSLTLVGPPYYERGSGCTGTQTIDCYLDFVSNGAATRVVFDVTAGSPGPATITFAVTDQTDANAADNTASVTISVAAASPAVPASPTPAAPARTASRTVKVDRVHNTLRKIARWKLHDGGKWRTLYTANRRWFTRRHIPVAKAADRRLPVGLVLRY
jgi:hypothetical protein